MSCTVYGSFALFVGAQLAGFQFIFLTGWSGIFLMAFYLRLTECLINIHARSVFETVDRIREIHVLVFKNIIFYMIVLSCFQSL